MGVFYDYQNDNILKYHIKILKFLIDDEDADVLPEEDQSDVEMSDAESEHTNKANQSKKKRKTPMNSDDDDPTNEESGDDEMAIDM